MSKIFRTPELELVGTQRINEDLWFKVHQPLLIEMLKTKYGRDLLCVDRKDVVGIAKNRITRQIGDSKFITEFRIGSKWANVIRYRWSLFNEYARYFDSRLRQQFFHVPGVRVPQYVNTLSVFYPDASPESTSVDGWTSAASNSPWTNLVNASGNGSSDTAGAGTIFIEFKATSSTDNWNYIVRPIFLFDTAALPDGDDISDATFDLYVSAESTTLSETYEAGVVSSLPAVNTQVANGDYDAFGSTLLSDKIEMDTLTTTSYNTWTLNATGIAAIDKTGVSKFGMREMNYDVTDTAPTWGSLQLAGFTGSYADDTGTTRDPKLSVTHGVAAAAGGASLYIYNYYH